MLKVIVYDFDGTLTPDELPKFDILEKCGLENETQNPAFLQRVKSMALEEKIGLVEATITTILNYIQEAGIPVTDEQVCLGAENRQYNLGVKEFLQKMKALGVKNILLSSGSKAYLEKTKVAPLFDEIYASTMKYDNAGEAIGVEYVLDEPEKANVLRAIAESVNNDPENCQGVVYIGDGPTDLYAMKYVKTHGGKTIMIRHDKAESTLVEQNQDAAVDYEVPASYQEGSELDGIIRSLL